MSAEVNSGQKIQSVPSIGGNTGAGNGKTGITDVISDALQNKDAQQMALVGLGAAIIAPASVPVACGVFITYGLWKSYSYFWGEPVRRDAPGK